MCIYLFYYSLKSLQLFRPLKSVSKEHVGLFHTVNTNVNYMKSYVNKIEMMPLQSVKSEQTCSYRLFTYNRFKKGLLSVSQLLHASSHDSFCALSASIH